MIDTNLPQLAFPRLEVYQEQKLAWPPSGACLQLTLDPTVWSRSLSLSLVSESAQLAMRLVCCVQDYGIPREYDAFSLALYKFTLLLPQVVGICALQVVPSILDLYLPICTFAAPT